MNGSKGFITSVIITTILASVAVAALVVCGWHDEVTRKDSR